MEKERKVEREWQRREGLWKGSFNPYLVEIIWEDRLRIVLKKHLGGTLRGESTWQVEEITEGNCEQIYQLQIFGQGVVINTERKIKTEIAKASYSLLGIGGSAGEKKLDAKG